MERRKRLQLQDLDNYEKQAELLNEKIQYLKECHIVEADGASKFELKKKIEESEKELEKVHKAISDILNPYENFSHEILTEFFSIMLKTTLSDNDLKNVYHSSLPADFPAYADVTLRSVMAHLCSIPKHPDHPPPILNLIREITEIIDPKTTQPLKDWLEQFPLETDSDTKKTEPEPPCETDPFSKFAPYLLVIIRPDGNNANTDKEDNKLYSLKILFWRNEKDIVTWYCNDEKDKKSYSIKKLSEFLDDILAKDYNNNKAPRKSSEVPKTIEFFLPFELISCNLEHESILRNVDQWDIKNTFLSKSKVGKEYHVVIRSLDRLEEVVNPIVHEKWAERWEQFQCLNTTDTVLWLCEPDEYEAESLCNDLECGDHQHITCMMMAFQPSDENQFLYAILDTGIPVALWFRKHPDCKLDSQEIKNKIKAVISDNNLNELPKLIKETRKKAKENNIGNHLTLFWEDRYRIPPEYWDKFDISLRAPEIRK